jgi:hypothetical protein
MRRVSLQAFLTRQVQIRTREYRFGIFPEDCKRILLDREHGTVGLEKPLRECVDPLHSLNLRAAPGDPFESVLEEDQGGNLFVPMGPKRPFCFSSKL